MQAGPQPLPPGRALVRAARVVQEGRCGQAGRPDRRSVGGRDGGAASAAAVRAALGVGEPWDRRSPAVASTPGAYAGAESAQGVLDRRCRASGAPDGSRSGRQRVTQGAGGAAERFLAAVEAGPVRRYEVALGLQPFQARGGFTDMLDGLLEQLREQARTGGEAGKVVEAIARVLEARDLAQGNVNPQLLAAVLADELGGEPA